MNCKELQSLIEASEKASSRYSAANRDVVRLTGRVTRTELDLLRAASEAAQADAIKARSNVETHRIEHGCGFPSTQAPK